MIQIASFNSSFDSFSETEVKGSIQPKTNTKNTHLAFYIDYVLELKLKRGKMEKFFIASPPFMVQINDA